MSVLERYTRAMVAGRTDECIAIEKEHDLLGYPPALVSHGLAAYDKGLNPVDEVELAISEMGG